MVLGFFFVTLEIILICIAVNYCPCNRALKKAGCFHDRGHNAPCRISGNLYLIIFGLLELILSQLPSLEEISWLSVVATIMSFVYSSIGLGLSIEKTVGVHACPCFHFFKVIA